MPVCNLCAGRLVWSGAVTNRSPKPSLGHLQQRAFILISSPKYKRILLKLSGEVLMGQQPYGIDLDTVGRLADEVLAWLERPDPSMLRPL